MCFSVEIEQDLKRLSTIFNALIDEEGFEQAQRNIEKWPQFFFDNREQPSRIYPNGYAPVVIKKKNQLVITPMRYRVRPLQARHEVPPKYNLFNARRDSLFTRKTWSELLGQPHAVFPFTHFYEWVEDPYKKKKLVKFSPQDQSLLWAPALTSQYIDPSQNLVINSFALITDDPPEEVLQAGHDRCPINLEADAAFEWLESAMINKEKMDSIFGQKKQVRYVCAEAAEPAKKRKKTDQLDLFDLEEF
ncbi:MAG: hypothetical protein Fur0010_01960 [Bdellovibrio sp.]